MRQLFSRLSRKVLIIGGLVLGVVLITGVGLAAAAALHGASQAASAQVASTPTPGAPAQKPGGHLHLVRVVSVNASNNTITVVQAGANVKNTQAQQHTLTVSSSTKITKYGQPASFKDIQPDEYLIVAGKDTQHIARIDILGYGAAGTIQTISGSSLTIQNAQGQMVTITTTSSTKIIEGHLSVGVSALRTGEMIQAFGDRGSNGSLSARLIYVHLIHGQVTAITGNTLTLSQGAKGKTMTVTTSAATTYYVDGKQVPASTLQVGDRIGVAGAVTDQTSVQATTIFIHEPGVAGKVTAVHGNMITLQTKNGTPWRITVNSSTEYLKNGQPAALSDVQVGSLIEVVGLKTGDNALTAIVVHIHAASK